MGKKLRDEDLVLNIIVNGDRGKKEIGELEKAIKDTNSEIREMEKLQEELRKSNKKETEEYKAVTAAIKQKNQAVDLANNRLKQLKNGLDLNSMSLSDLRRRMTEISRLRNIATPGTEEWKRQNEELQRVQRRYRELRGESIATGKGLENMVSGITSKVGIFAAGLASIGITTSGIKNLSEEYAQFDDRLSDVMKTTGRTKDEVVLLNASLKEMDTRTAQNDLLGLARVAGKLGIEGQEDILGFVRAADKIGVALSEDLGGDVETAIREVGKLVDIFNVRDEFGIEQGLNKVGSVINALGQASTANEEYLVDFTKRLAGIAPAAGISISNVLGLASTMDQLGQSAEVSGTTFVNLIPKMFQETAEFARIANIDVQEFSDLLNTDANEAMIRLLEGVRGNEGSMRDLVMRLKDLGLDGARATAVVSVLANNTELLRNEQALANIEFDRGTSLIEEFSVKNENAQAKLEKARKELFNLRVELGERLLPLLSSSISAFSMVIRVLTTVVDFFIKNQKVIIPLISSYVAYNAIVFALNLNLKENIVLSKLKVFWDNSMLASTQLLAAAQMLLAGNIKGASQAMRVFNSVAKLNPWVLLASAIIAAGTALYLYTRRLSEAETAQKTMNEIQGEAQRAIINEKLEMEKLLRIARDKKRSDDERLEAVQALNKLSPKYLGNLTLEKINTEEATLATDNYIKSLLKRAAVQAAEERLVDIQKKKLDLAKDATDLSFFEEVQGALIGRGNVISKKLTENAKDLLAQEKALLKFIDESEEKIKPTGLGIGGSTTTIAETPEEKAAREANEKAAKEEAERRRKELEAESKKLEAERQKELDRQAEFRRKTIEGALSLVEQEKLAFQRRLEEAGIAGKSRENLTREELETLEILEADHYRKLSDINAKAIDDRLAQMQYMHEQELTAMRIQHNEEFKEIDTMEKARAFLRGKMSDDAINNLRNMREAQRAIDKIFLQEEEELIRGHLESIAREIENLLNLGVMQGIDLSDQILSEEDKEVLKQRLQELKLLMSELGIKSSTSEEETTGQLRTRISNTDVLGFRPEDWKTLFENLEKGKFGVEQIIQTAQALTNIWAGYNASVSMGERNRLAQFEQNSIRQQEILKQQLDIGLINQDIYNQQVAKLNADLDKKKAVFARNEAKREREVAIMTALINTYQAATAALTIPPPFGKILAGIVTALGLKQVDNIRKTPLPEIPGAAEGGFLEDVVRSQDSKRFRARREPFRRSFVDRPTVIVGEEGTEFVANNRAVRNPTVRPVLDAIDTAQRNGSIDTLNLFKILEQSRQLSTVMPGRRSGGTISGAPVSSTVPSTSMAVTPEMMDMIQNNNRLLQLMLRRFSRPIKADVSLIGKGSLEESQEELSEIQRSANI